MHALQMKLSAGKAALGTGGSYLWSRGKISARHRSAQAHHQTPAHGEQRETLQGGGPGTSLQGQCTLINNNLSHITV